MPSPRCVVLLSGGLDSGTAYALEVERGGGGFLCLFVDYGQPALAREREAASALCGRFGGEWCEVALPWLAGCSARAGSALQPGGEAPTIDEDRGPEGLGDDDSARAVWVPARNLVLLGVAAAHAEALGARELIVGFNREEAATFPDNGTEFLRDMDRVLANACRSPVRITAPVAGLDKPGIASEARRLGLAPADFWSCYRDRDPEAACRCEACVRSARAWSSVRP